MRETKKQDKNRVKNNSRKCKAESFSLENEEESVVSDDVSSDNFSEEIEDEEIEDSHEVRDQQTRKVFLLSSIDTIMIWLI